MSSNSFYQIEKTAADGTPVRLVYDREADMLEFFFGQNEPATGVGLNDHIVLRLNTQTRRAISLSVLHFSVLTEQTQYGPRSYALDKLEDVSEELQETVLQVLRTMPVSQFLKVTHFQASPTEQIPVTYVESQPDLNAA